MGVSRRIKRESSHSAGLGAGLMGAACVPWTRRCRYLRRSVVLRSMLDAWDFEGGRLYMQMGSTALAVDTLKKSLQLSPKYGPTLGLLEYMKVDVNALVP